MPFGITSPIVEWTALPTLLADPENKLLTTNIVKSHSRYTIQTAKALRAKQHMLYNKYEKNNNHAAVKFVLSSLSPALMIKIKRRWKTRIRFTSSGCT